MRRVCQKQRLIRVYLSESFIFPRLYIGDEDNLKIPSRLGVIRVCMDMRHVNEAIIHERHPI